MKNFDVKELSLSTLVIAGILASALSFVYYFVWKNPYEIIFWLICAVDFWLFTLNAHYIVSIFDLSKAKTVLFTILTMIFFPVFCVVVVFAFTVGTRFPHTFELLFDVLRISLFLSPSFILLLPVMWLIAEVMG